MDHKEFNKAMEETVQKRLLEEPDHWLKQRRQRWDEWGSPVGLTIAWTLFIVPLGLFLYLLHLSGII